MSEPVGLPFFLFMVFVNPFRHRIGPEDVMVMVMVIYTALVRSHQSTSAGSFGLVRPAWIRYTRSAGYAAISDLKTAHREEGCHLLSGELQRLWEDAVFHVQCRSPV